MITCDTADYPIEDVRDPRVFAVNCSTTHAGFIDYAWSFATDKRVVVEPLQEVELTGVSMSSFSVGYTANGRTVWFNATASPCVEVVLRSQPLEVVDVAQ